MDGVLTVPFDPKLLALVVHDLRNPLNVVNLASRMIERQVPRNDADLAEDLDMLRQNVAQLDRLLLILGDYCRLIEGDGRPTPLPASAVRLIEESAEAASDRLPDERRPPIRVIRREGSPDEVFLDLSKARTALVYAIRNTLVSATQGPIELTLEGQPDRFHLRVTLLEPPRETVRSTDLIPHRFERIGGNAADRRGLDLAIAALVSEQFGGSARLEVEPGRSSTIVLDWPARLPEVN